jgi:hypothetical protein
LLGRAERVAPSGFCLLPRVGGGVMMERTKPRVSEMLCQLCESDDAHSFHHFIPRTLHGNKWFKKRYTRAQMREGIDVCKWCHAAIHDLIPSEKELGRHYNTMESLLAHPEVGKYVQWKRGRAKDGGRNGRTHTTK